MQDKYQFFRQFISSFLHGKTNAEALLQTLADSAQKNNELSVAVTDQLTISTASDIYLDKRLAEVGITRPPELGMDDLAFRRLGIQLNSTKQLLDSIHAILATFYGDDTVRAFATSGHPEPFYFEDGDSLSFSLENTEYNVTFRLESFNNIQEATAKEVSDIITRHIRGLGGQGYAQEYTDIDTGQKYVRIFGNAMGPFSSVQILGGEVQTEMEFQQIRATELLVNDTVWEITRTIGSIHRFRWVSGTRPLLEKVFQEDKALIYGDQFRTAGIYGTFDVLNVRPAQLAPAVNAGWFEIDLPGYNELNSSMPDQNPPPNTITETYSFTLTQAQFADLKFFLAKKNIPNHQKRFALAWEPKSNLLKIYMPASTRVVRRNLIGSAHLHFGTLSVDFDGSFGHLTDNSKKVVITGDRSIKYKQNGATNISYGGTLTAGSPLDIDYIFRENGWVSVFTKDPHGLTGTIVNGLNLFSGVIAIQTNAPADQPSDEFLGPYIVDPTANYTLTSQIAKIKEEINIGENKKSLLIEGMFTDQSGQFILDLNKETQEGPINFLAVQKTANPNQQSLVLDQSYIFKFDHAADADITVISDNKAYEPEIDGSDYSPYITGTADGRIFAEQMIREITALGINLEIVIVYPNDIGLANEGGSDNYADPPTSEKVYVWGQ